MKYFCWRCSHEHDDEYETPTRSAIGPVCPTCEAKRNDAFSQFKAECMQEHVEATEKRHAH